jgi:ectoine hydroxylase
MSALGKKQQNIDPYISRVSDTPLMTERQDPVIYGEQFTLGENAGPLSFKQLEAYNANGFLFFESLFNGEEVAWLLGEVEHLKTLKELEGSDYVIREPESNEIRSFFYVHQFDDVFKVLAQDERIVNIAEQILGSQVYIHQSRVNLKPGFKGKEFYWHSDFETWFVEDGMPRMRALSCSITLTDNNEFNGPLMLIPGSHNQYISCVGQTPENHHLESLRKQEYGVPDDQIMTALIEQNGIVAPKGKAGSVIFFECNVMHGSNGNITPYPRTSVFFVYNSVENTLVDPYSGMQPRPEHIATRKDFNPIQASRLQNVLKDYGDSEK